jgi:hypothetical protein
MIQRFKSLHTVRRNHALLITHNSLHSMLFVLPVLVPYYHDVIGLSFSQFLLGEVLFSTIVVLMEVPSGWLADMWKRRLVLMIGSLTEIFGFALLLNADSFAMALLVQGSLGIGVSLISGTNTALLYDTLLQFRMTRHFRRLEGMRHSMGLYIIGFASLAGRFLYTVNPRLPLMLTLGTCTLAAIAAFLMHEPVRVRQPMRRNPFYDVLKTIAEVKSHPEIVAIILFCGILFGTTQAGVWVQQPYYLARNVAEHWFGVLACIGFLLAGFAGHYGHRLETMLSARLAFTAVLYGVAASYLLAGSAPGWWGIAFLYASSLSYGFGMPLIQDAINSRIASDRRASIISTASLAGRLVFIPIGWTVSHAAASFGIDWTIAGMGIFLAVTGSGVLMVMRRKNMI